MPARPMNEAEPRHSAVLRHGDAGGLLERSKRDEHVFRSRSGDSPRARRHLDLAGIGSWRASSWRASSWRPARPPPSRPWWASPSWRRRSPPSPRRRLARFALAWTALERAPDHRAGWSPARPCGGGLSRLRPARGLWTRLHDHPAGRADTVGMAQGRDNPDLPRPVGQRPIAARSDEAHAAPITAKRRPAEADLGLSSRPGTTRQRTGFVLCRAVAMPLRCSRPPRAFPP